MLEELFSIKELDLETENKINRHSLPGVVEQGVCENWATEEAQKTQNPENNSEAPLLLGHVVQGGTGPPWNTPSGEQEWQQQHFSESKIEVRVQLCAC